MGKRAYGGLWALLLAASALSAAAADPAFSDRTSESGINVLYDPPLNAYLHANYTGGGTAGDFDRDGLQDVFVLDGDGTDHLYMNNGDGTFTDRAAQWNLTVSHRGKGASVADYNGDGWLDIYVTSAGSGAAAPCNHKLYRNNGNGTFTNVAAGAGVNCTTTSSEDGFGSGWGDYDLDGDLDLFVAGFANGNSGNHLFRNNGNGTFTDVTAAIGFFDETPVSMKSFTPHFVDLNDDDYPDLPLISDFGTSRYFRNNGDGTFSDITSQTGAAKEENGMGMCVGDFNRDGKLDYYATSIYLPSVSWTGNKLYLGAGNHHFNEVSNSAGVYDGGYGWAALGVDFNHDGWQDIFETNGDDSTGGGPFYNEQAYLWMNDGDGTYTEQAIASGLIHYGKGRGMSHFDADNDGDQDIVIFANRENVRYYRNDLTGPATNWLRVFLDTGGTPGIAPDGIGSRVWATTGLTTQLRYLSSGDNFLSHSELSAHFGLGGATNVNLLKVHWSNGPDMQISDVEPNQTLTLVAGHGNCAPAPEEVTGLMVSKEQGELHLSWDDTGALGYVVLAGSAPNGALPLLMGKSPSAGLDLPMPAGTRYFIVAGRDGVCIGP